MHNKAHQTYVELNILVLVSFLSDTFSLFPGCWSNGRPQHGAEVPVTCAGVQASL